MKDVNLETFIDTMSTYKIWQINRCNHIRAKPTLLREQKRAYKSSWSRRGTKKSFTLDNSPEFGKACEDLSRLDQFGNKVLPETFLGFVLYAGGILNGDISVADIEESGTHPRVLLVSKLQRR